MLSSGRNWLGILINSILMGGYIVKYPQSLTGIILMYDSPLCWIGNVTEINQTFPNIPVPKEYVSIYCDLQANNPLLECFWSEFPSEDLRFIVIWSSVGWMRRRTSKKQAAQCLKIFKVKNLCLPTCTYKHLTQYSYFLIGCFNKLFPRLLYSSFESSF